MRIHDDVIEWKNFPRYWPFVIGNSPIPVNSPHKMPVTRSFGVFFDLRLNKRLSKQQWGWWIETPSWSLWRQCYEGLREISSAVLGKSCDQRRRILIHLYVTELWKKQQLTSNAVVSTVPTYGLSLVGPIHTHTSTRLIKTLCSKNSYWHSTIPHWREWFQLTFSLIAVMAKSWYIKPMNVQTKYNQSIETEWKLSCTVNLHTKFYQVIETEWKQETALHSSIQVWLNPYWNVDGWSDALLLPKYYNLVTKSTTAVMTMHCFDVVVP